MKFSFVIRHKKNFIFEQNNIRPTQYNYMLKSLTELFFFVFSVHGEGRMTVVRKFLLLSLWPWRELGGIKGR